jgi:hypothetical protein
MPFSLIGRAGRLSSWIVALFGAAHCSSPAKSEKARAPITTRAQQASCVEYAEHDTPDALVFGVLGDYGVDNSNEGDVAKLMHGWPLQFIVTLGDNNYPYGSAESIDANIGRYYHSFIAPYRGAHGLGACRNRFFPSLGNHDWGTPEAKPYRDYFELPGNERYYDLVWGDVHLFALDSDPNEPDGVASDSVQAQWLQSTLAASTSRWNIVYMHHPPFSSGPHAPTTYMQWPYKEWGADLVLGGHDHDYERLNVDGMTYIVCGLGGAANYPIPDERVPGSQFAFTGRFGAGRITASATALLFEFITTDGKVVDQVTLSPRR